MPNAPVQRYCVVCGIGSHRTTWLKGLGNEVACDSHSPEEIKAAVEKKQAASAVAVTKAS